MRIVATRVAAAIAVLSAGALLAACGGSSASTTTPATPATPAAAKTVDVKFGEYFYNPKVVHVAVGGTVRFVNAGKIPHTVADATKSGTVLSKIIQPHALSTGQSQSVTFHARGTVYYLCTFHPGLMRGEVVVG